MRALVAVVIAVIAVGLVGVSLAQSDPAEKRGDDANNQDGPKKNAPKRVKIGKIDWYVSYDAALAVAKKEKKLLWLHFGENPG